jgi:hypothetical protein
LQKDHIKFRVVLEYKEGSDRILLINSITEESQENEGDVNENKYRNGMLKIQNQFFDDQGD